MEHHFLIGKKKRTCFYWCSSSYSHIRIFSGKHNW